MIEGSVGKATGRFGEELENDTYGFPLVMGSKGSCFTMYSQSSPSHFLQVKPASIPTPVGIEGTGGVVPPNAR